MANSSSCSQECQAPLYIATSLTLAFMAIIAFFAMHHPTTPPSPLLLPSPHAAALNASHALRLLGGFHITATLLQFSPDLFFPSNPPIYSTIFAMQDSAITNLSLPPSSLRELLRYHTSPSALPATTLLKKQPGFCFETLVNDQTLMITKKVNASQHAAGSIMINNVMITHPDMFLEGLITVHGVNGPFDVINPSSCGVSNYSDTYTHHEGNVDIWNGIIRYLSSNGYVAFAIGVNSVLDGIVNDYESLGFVTILAPPNSGIISSPEPLLDRIVKVHILPGRFSYLELGAAENSSLRTLVPGFNVRVERVAESLVVNGVEITKPDMFSSKDFVIHGISRAFDGDELFSSSK